MSTKKDFTKVLAASKSESILAVIEGLPIDASGYFMTEEQMTAVEDQLDANATAIASHATEVEGLTGQVTAAQAAQKTAEDSLVASIAEKDARINELQAQVAKLEAGTPEPDQTKRDKDDTAGKNAGWVNPMNKIADSLLGTPKPKKD